MNDGDNYRGISIIPIITKLVELIIIHKCPQLKDHEPSQFGFVSGSSTLHPEVLIQDTVSFYNNQGSPVYICSLDAEKAFDSCNWYRLFEKLTAREDIPKAVIKFLIQLYLQSEAAILYDKHTSKSFRLSQGVRQGSLLSPYLYNFYTEELLRTINSMNLGTFLPGNIRTSIIAYADDIILISPTLTGLQQMLDACTNYGQYHGIKFKHSKTQFIISGKCELPNPQLSIYNNTIKPKDELHHLGFIWKKSHQHRLNLKSHREYRIREMWSITSSLISAGVRKLHPNTIINLFRTLVLPKLSYGLEIVNMSLTESCSLDSQARSCLKSLLGVSKHSRNYAHQIYDIPEVSHLLSSRKHLILRQLVNNRTTQRYLLHLATLNESDRGYSIIANFFQCCTESGNDIISILLGDKSYRKRKKTFGPDNRELTLCKHYILHWHDYECRKAFKEVLEAYILR